MPISVPPKSDCLCSHASNNLIYEPRGPQGAPGSECGPWACWPGPPTVSCCLRLCALLTCDDATTNKTKRQLGTKGRERVLLDRGISRTMRHRLIMLTYHFQAHTPNPPQHALVGPKPKRLYNWLGLALPIKHTLYLSLMGEKQSFINISISISSSLVPTRCLNNNLCTVYKDINLYCNCKVYANRWQVIFLSRLNALQIKLSTLPQVS